MDKKLLTVISCIIVLILIFGLFLFLRGMQEVSSQELKHEYLKFKEEYLKKKNQGYDLREVAWWIKKARKEYLEGNYEKAKEYLDKAFLALEEAEKTDFSLPEAPERGWDITEKPNTFIDKIPTVEDWVPIGITYNLEDNLLRYVPGYPWQQSCFIFIAIGESKEGDTLFYQGRLPFEGGFAPRININGKYLRNVPVFKGGMYYYEEGAEGYPYPVILVYGTKGYKEILSYDEENQIWYHEIIPPDENGLKIKIKAKALGVPFWMGLQEGPYVVHGAYSGIKDIDVWGGFWVVGKFEGEVKLPQQREEKEFSGYFLFDRAIHIAYYAQQEYRGESCREVACPARGGVVEFSCLAIFGDDFIITLCDSRNPTPVKFPKFQHQGRISYIFNESYPFNNFTLKSFGPQLQPTGFELKGSFEGGNVDLRGNIIEYWPPKGWVKVEGTWWDPEGKRTWGRALVLWKGEVKFRGETIKVKDAIGIGEFTRFESG